MARSDRVTSLGGITVEAREYEVHTQIGEDYAGKANDREDGKPLSSPASNHTGVEQGGIDKPCD